MAQLVLLLQWLDALPARYWTCVYLTSGMVFASAFWAYLSPASTRRWNRPAVFAALLILALLSFRWPAIFDNRQGNNPDESQIIAGAMVLKSHPVFWERVDGTTHGPLVQLPLAALGALGMRLDYTNVRLVSAALAWAMLVFIWLTLRVPFGDGVARLLLIPAAVFEITTTFWDFTQYSSEHIPIVLLAAATWLIVRELLGPYAPSARNLSIAGILLGAVPLAKLQGTPIGMWLGLVGLVLIACAQLPWRTRIRLGGAFVAGALVVPLVFLVAVAGRGILTEVWIDYIKTNLIYVSSFPLTFTEGIRVIFRVVDAAGSFREYFRPALILVAVGVCLQVARRDRAAFRFTLLTLGMLVVSAYAVATPNRIFPHYAQLLIAPLALTVGALFGPLIIALQHRTAPYPPWWRATTVLAGGAIFVSAACYWVAGNFQFREPYAVGRINRTGGQLVRSPIAQRLFELTKRNDEVAIWGWEPRYLVEARLRHATRVAHSALELFQSPLQQYYRNRYLADLQRTRPAVFVDVVGPGSFFFDKRNEYGHEIFPALAQYVAAHYHLAAEVESARIYVRND